MQRQKSQDQGGDYWTNGKPHEASSRTRAPPHRRQRQTDGPKCARRANVLNGSTAGRANRLHRRSHFGGEGERDYDWSLFVIVINSWAFVLSSCQGCGGHLRFPASRRPPLGDSLASRSALCLRLSARLSFRMTGRPRLLPLAAWQLVGGRCLFHAAVFSREVAVAVF